VTKSALQVASALGFGARPVGSLVLGAVGDRIGRRALLTLSIALMGIAANFMAHLLQKHRWIAYVGLAIILYVSLKMIYEGFLEVSPLVNGAVG